MRRFVAKLSTFFRRQRSEAEMVREIAAHLALLEEDFERQGMSSKEARLAALRAFGGIEQAKERHRDERSFVWLEQLLQDVRHAARSLRKSPGFAAVALLSLAFGIGVNTAIFTLVNGILLKTLPIPQPERVVQLQSHFKEFDSRGFTYPAFREIQRQTAVFSAVVGFASRSGNLEVGGEPRKVEYQIVSGGFFPFFAGRPALGRLLDAEDDRVEGANPVCVLSHHAWQTHFGGDSGIINRTIHMGGVPLRVVGVVAPEFVGPELQRRFDLWIPTTLNADFFHNSRENPHSVWIWIMARLVPGISFAEANARIAAASTGINSTLPKGAANSTGVYQLVEARNGADSWRSSMHEPLVILMWAVTLVLLVACANIANLLLARTNERRQEFAIKLSLGISRGRLLRQMLLETCGLALCGGAVGLLFSLGLVRSVLTLFNAGNNFRVLRVSPDVRVLLYTFAASLLTALVAGLYPAWQASRTDTGPGLKGLAHAGRRSFMRRTLILVQVTVAVILLFCASLFTHSLRKLRLMDLGYDIDRVLAVNIEDSGPRKALKPIAAPPALADVLARVRQLPGVESAAYSEPGPLSGGMMGTNISYQDAAGNARTFENAYIMFAGSGFFSTLRMQLRQGRDFSPGDRAGSPPVFVVNQRLASLLWPGQNPIGRQISGWGIKSGEIVGVVANSKYQGLREDTRAIAYQAFEQSPVTEGMLQIRCRGLLRNVERDVRKIVKTTAPGYQVGSATSMELMRDNIIAGERLAAFLSSLFGALGTMLALVGIYGLIAYSVTRRTREIGIRISVGAQRRDVLWLIVRESVMLVAGGLLLGIPLALRLSRFVAEMLYQVKTSEPLDISATVLLLALGGLAASLVPGRRATRINPVEALRYD